ncbi:hypothetical protein ACIRL2_47255 [Embleya sp. NPDC127516]|uniref:hypothetical protein n=1 Tax=Embleya sp. NPDC127516 TaxID=3363990 RepID=UPI0038163E1D
MPAGAHVARRQQAGGSEHRTADRSRYAAPRAVTEYFAYARAHTNPLDTLFALHPTDRPSRILDPAPSRATAEAFDHRGQALRLLGYPAKYARALDAIEDAWDRKIGRASRIVLDAGRPVRILRNGIAGDDLRDRADEPAFAELDWAAMLFDHVAKRRSTTEDHPLGVLRVLARLHRHMTRLRDSAQQAEGMAANHVRRAFERTVDVSGEDLSGMEFTDIRVLENVLRRDDTRWSPVVARLVGRSSRLITEGVYHVQFDGLHEYEPAWA